MEEEFNKAIEAIVAANVQDEIPQNVIPHSEICTDILMLDQVTKRPLTPMLATFFSIVGEWKEAILSKDIIHPNTLEQTYQEPRYVHALRLRRENFWPHPPWAEEDLRRTALFAWDRIDEGEAYFWWRDDETEEPMIVNFFGGSVKYWKNLRDYMNAYAFSRSDLSIDLLEQLKSDRSNH